MAWKTKIETFDSFLFRKKKIYDMINLTIIMKLFGIVKTRIPGKKAVAMKTDEKEIKRDERG